MPAEAANVSAAYDAALFGHDPTPRIVALHPLAHGADAEQAMMRVYRRDETCAGLLAEEVPFYPFFFLADIRLLRGFPRQRFLCQTLKGSNYYRYLVVFNTWQAHWDAVRHLEEVTRSKERTVSKRQLVTSVWPRQAGPISKARTSPAPGMQTRSDSSIYYLKRLDEFARKFEPFFTAHDFRRVFAPEDLFGFSATEIRLQNTERDGGQAR